MSRSDIAADLSRSANIAGDLGRSDVAADLHFEICLRQRIASALHDRLHWALSLHHSLSSPSPSRPSEHLFKSAAHDAITAIEAPCGLIFSRSPPPPPRTDLRLSRPPPRPKSMNPPHSYPSFLYIQSSALGYGQCQDELYLLRCPQCLRTTFSNLQGLLNHARIAHRLEWGTHEDCVRECAVPRPGLDTTAGVQVGLGPGGILPGLRTIFRMAVSPQTNQPATCELHAPATSPAASLGLHEESPALAPFLGRSPVRRGIKVYEQDDTLDIVNLGNCTSHYPRFPLPLRSVASQRVHGFEQALRTEHPSTQQSSRESAVSEIGQPTTISSDSARSRFYFTARIVVTDRSIWIPPHCRAEIHHSHSHKWMISVHSPSYACELSTILKSVMVIPLNTVGSAVSGPSVDSPPYVVVGTSDSPFLARVEFLFNGIGTSQVGSPISKTQKIILEHWVELDPVKSPTPAIGEEQIMDIELDKQTIIGPVRPSHTTIDSKVLWDVTRTRSSANLVEKTDAAENEDSNYSRVLKRLEIMYPLVKGESKNDKVNAVDLPYKLRTQSQHLSLNMGRRKAIEWRRATILRDAYLKETQVDRFDNEADLPPLSVGDVYSWLSTCGHFSRPLAKEKDQTATTEKDSSPCDKYCPVCGLDHETCKPTTQSCSELDVLPSASRCMTVHESCKIRKFPFLHAKGIMTPYTTPLADGPSVPRFELRHLLLNSNPKLVDLVKAVVKLLAFPTFRTEGGLENSDRTTTEGKLGPYALLSLATESFIRALVRSGLEMSRRDVDLALGKKRRREPKGMLTPSHILRAIARGNGGAVFECLARVGVVEANNHISPNGYVTGS